jgi:hypothetical protein
MHRSHPSYDKFFNISTPTDGRMYNPNNFDNSTSTDTDSASNRTSHLRRISHQCTFHARPPQANNLFHLLPPRARMEPPSFNRPPRANVLHSFRNLPPPRAKIAQFSNESCPRHMHTAVDRDATDKNGRNKYGTTARHKTRIGMSATGI